MRTDSPITILAGEDLEAYRRVRFNGTSYLYADAYERHDAITGGTRIVSGRYGDAYPVGVPGIVDIESAGSIAAGARINGKDDGKCDDDGAGYPIGINSAAAAIASGDPCPALASAAVKGTSSNGTKVFTANGSVNAFESGCCITNTGAAGAVTVALPAAIPGLQFKARVTTAQALQLDPNGTETISLPSTGVAGAAGKWLTSATIGVTVNLECFIAGTWSVVGHTGTWTAEA